FIIFYQAEDGIRYRNVTGVQTCALPIFAALYLIVPININFELYAFDRNAQKHHQLKVVNQTDPASLQQLQSVVKYIIDLSFLVIVPLQYNVYCQCLLLQINRFPPEGSLCYNDYLSYVQNIHR